MPPIASTQPGEDATCAINCFFACAGTPFDRSGQPDAFSVAEIADGTNRCRRAVIDACFVLSDGPDAMLPVSDGDECDIDFALNAGWVDPTSIEGGAS